jgi:hypothetical protein
MASLKKDQLEEAHVVSSLTLFGLMLFSYECPISRRLTTDDSSGNI